MVWSVDQLARESQGCRDNTWFYKKASHCNFTFLIMFNSKLFLFLCYYLIYPDYCIHLIIYRTYLNYFIIY